MPPIQGAFFVLWSSRNPNRVSLCLAFIRQHRQPGLVFSDHVKIDDPHNLSFRGQATVEVSFMKDQPKKEQREAKPSRKREKPISRVYPVIDNDLAQDNLENDIPAADLEDL